MQPVISYVTAGSIVVIDAGHGGPDSGAIGANGSLEKDISLALSQKLAQELIQQGCIVICARDTDQDLAGEDFSGPNALTNGVFGEFSRFQKGIQQMFVAQRQRFGIGFMGKIHTAFIQMAVQVFQNTFARSAR